MDSTNNSILIKMKYHANDWGIISDSEKEIERISGLEFLSSSAFRGSCVEYLVVDGKELMENISFIEEMMNKRWFFVVITNIFSYRRIQIINKISELFSSLRNDFTIEDIYELKFTFLVQIHECEDCCAGIVFSDGKGSLKIEIMPASVNTRNLTDGSMKEYKAIYLETGLHSLEVLYGRCSDYLHSPSYSYLIKEIVLSCYNTAGYYEFIFGSNQKFDFPNLYFTYFSDNRRYGFEDQLIWRWM